MSKEALRKALEALVYASSYCDTYDAIDAIKQDLAAPAAKPETDSCGSGAGCLYKVAMIENLESEVERLKAAQPAPEQYTALEQSLTRLQKRYGELEAKVAAQRPWVGLTDEQFRYFASTPDYGTGGLIRAIEAELKGNNT
jgi:hypothetical protein